VAQIEIWVLNLRHHSHLSFFQLFRGYTSFVNVIQLRGNFSLMGKPPVGLQPCGAVCFSVMGTQVR
jgi:hypothetical protein